ncbi:MAG: LytR C-terminal domain-containing protein [Actinobacteria bacterium]|nr:LytR C-terminal domain-containing protein [Actinomycetota bacterium]
MAGSAMKLVIVALALVAGVVLLTQGFDTVGSLPRGSTGTETTTSPPTDATTTPPPEETCERTGVVVYIYNGTNVTGLAALAGELISPPYVVPEVGNAASTFETTRLYWRAAADRVEAECLRDEFFPGGDVQQLERGSGVPRDAQVAVYLGSDFAADNPA